MTKDLFDFDCNYSCKIAGCDEAGRGPLAGPVVVAACKMPLEFIIEGINDSKKITFEKREKLYDKIITCADYSIVAIDENVIDEINILEATKKAMRESILSLKDVDLVLVDAVNLNLTVGIESIIKGDAKSYNIAAASILAKVYRDRFMLEIDKKYPQYGFASHKGYGTKAHIEALKKYGPCPIHRKSFIKNIIF